MSVVYHFVFDTHICESKSIVDCAFDYLLYGFILVGNDLPYTSIMELQLSVLFW